MADDPSSAAPDKNRTTIRRANVGVAKVRDAQFSRADIQTGEIKSLEGDILSEIKKSIDTQTQTLCDSFKKSIKDGCSGGKGGKGGKGGGGGSGGSGGGGRGTGKGKDDAIINALKEINSAVLALGPQIAMAGGEGGDGGGGGGGFGGSRRYRALSNSIEELGQSVDDAGNVTYKLTMSMDKIEEQIRENLNETIRNLNAEMTKTIRSFTHLSTFTDEVTDRFKKGMELASSSLLDFSDMYWEDTKKLVGAGDFGDSLVKTAEQIRKAVQDGVTSPMMMVQGDVRDVAREFKTLRADAESFGLDMYARVGWEEQNVLLGSLIDEQRRGSMQADFKDQGTRERAMEQLKFMTMVADNTGRSVKELMEMNKEQAKTFAELQGIGVITKEQAETFKMMSKSAPPEVQGLLQKIAESSGSSAVFSQKFPDLFEDLSKLGQQDLIQKLNDLSTSGLRGDELANAQTSILKEALGDTAGKFGKEASAIMFQGREIQGLIGGVSQMAKFQEGKGHKSPIIRAVNELGDFLENTFPLEWAKSIFALSANTIAVTANTIAQWKSNRGIGGGGGGGRRGRGRGGGGRGLFGRAGDMMGRVMTGGRPPQPGSSNFTGPTMPQSGGAGGGGGALGKLGTVLKGVGKVAGPVAALGTVAAVGKDIYDMSQGDTSGENMGALIGSAIGGTLGFLTPIPGGAMMGAALGNMAGEWLGGKFDESSEKAAGTPGVPKNAPTKPRTSAAASKMTGQQQTMASQMLKQTEILNGISMKIERSISVQTDIASGVGKIDIGTKQIVAKAGRGTSGGGAIFAESPSMDF